MSLEASALWRRLDRGGHEYARLTREGVSWLLSGVALFTDDAGPCRLDYSVRCDPSWVTTSAHVAGFIGDRPVEATISVDSTRSWRLNGNVCPDVDGCIDVDLNFSPSTNLLPVRRLDLQIGEHAEVHAAWLRFPDFTLERLVQTYTRIGERVYRYESGSGAFVAELQVDDAGLPVTYGNLWTRARNPA